jgi:hypothetical protein
LFGFSLWVSGLILSGVDKNDKDDGRNDEFLGFFIRQILKKKIIILTFKNIKD